MDSRVLLGMVLAVGLGSASGASNDRPLFGVFCGSTPCGEAIREVLRIPTNGAPELMEWKLTLYQDSKAAPSRYELHCRYGSTAPNKPGLAKDVKTLERQGTWTISKGTRSDPDATVYELAGAVSLYQVDVNVLHMLNPDCTLMFATSGWSYTLNRTEHAEKSPDRALVLAQPDMSYQIAPLASGPTVFGVFEGRSPCQGIARELKSQVNAGCNKVKWRVTLYQNAETRTPTSYKIEGSLYRQNAREGQWTIMRGTAKDPNAIVYQLAAAKSEPAIFLLKGDDNVLFLLDQKRSPFVGGCDFSYTLNRRIAVTAAPPES